MGHFGGLGGTLESSLMFLESTWVDFGGPWELLGRTLEVLGLILECLGHPKLMQSGPGWNLVDFLETYENIMVLKGFRGGRLPG